MSAIARGAGAAPGTNTPAGETRPLLELKDVHTHIGAYHILHGVDLTVPAGQVTMLLGRNGAGKTTTLRTIMGLWKPRRAMCASTARPPADPACACHRPTWRSAASPTYPRTWASSPTCR